VVVEVLIFEPPGSQYADLRRDFRAESPRQWDVRLVSALDELLGFLQQDSHYHLVIMPERLGDMPGSGIDLIAPIQEVDREIPVVIAAEQGNVELAARVIAAGASDLLVLGEHIRERIATLLGKLRGLFQVIEHNRMLREQNAELCSTIQARLNIVGQSPQIRSLLDQIRRVAQVPRPVLVWGERGTGKELVARAIHASSGVATCPIVTVNCAAFSDALLESELFGHEKGAFTGADCVRHGKFELADGGTLFLDEIGNMSMAFQEKILRVVEYGTFTRVGGTVERTTKARIIAATNRDLPQMIARGEFLADLYDRLTFETIFVPPLRERMGDIEVLARHFLDQFARETPAFGGKRLSSAALAQLARYAFPGNVRELKNVIERAAYRDTTNEITPDDLGLFPQSAMAAHNGDFHQKIESFGRQLIEEALRHAGGNQAQAARQLGLSYHQFRYYHRKYSLSAL
jgi:DNA-binding NtrC family response regulator